MNTPLPPWVSEDLALDKPSAARMYDYFIGGFHNFAIDRAAAEYMINLYPDMPLLMQANRAFLRRAVKFFVQQGIDQFLDLGSIIPTPWPCRSTSGGRRKFSTIQPSGSCSTSAGPWAC